MLTYVQALAEVRMLQTELADVRSQLAWLKQKVFGPGQGERRDRAQLLRQIEALEKLVPASTPKQAVAANDRTPAQPRTAPAEVFANLPVAETVEVPAAVKRKRRAGKLETAHDLYARIGEPVHLPAVSAVGVCPAGQVARSGGGSAANGVDPTVGNRGRTPRTCRGVTLHWPSALQLAGRDLSADGLEISRRKLRRWAESVASPLDMKKAGHTPGRTRRNCQALLGQQHVPRVLKRAGYRALMLSGEARVFAGQNLARIRDITAHRLRGGKRNLGGRRCLLLLLGGAHGSKEKRSKSGSALRQVNLHFWVAFTPDPQNFAATSSP